MGVFIVFAMLFMQIYTIRATVPAVIVFGDSSVDAGNNNQIQTVLKSNFRPYGRDFFGGKPTGRFSNGRVPPDFISESFGLRPYVPAYLDPAYNISDFATGVCFASAGTGYDNTTSDVLSVIPLWKEVEYYKEYQKKLRDYLGDQKANTIISEAVYLTSMGTNDFLENYYTLPNRRSQYNINQYQDYLVTIAESFIKELYGVGARKVSLGGLPPMGCLPLERTTSFMNGNGGTCNTNYNKVAMAFNGKLSGLVERLNSELPGSKIVFSNPYPIFEQIVQKPSSFGFASASVACCATGLFEMGYMCDQYNPFTCSNANTYVFWDSFHPTEKTNRIISDHLFKTVLSTLL
ncbi:putative triacylglycerol lipase [Helianthus annuus]|uniref:Putative SGNH hydrolase-type esterase domain-containing protein n=1 Tax=Helianthus annuus TaxID=4232 RepID=A0A251RXU8_HELAN|nr:GDSL esterase/lipase At2g04570 [Helianthus annuus]KAF5758858.1 putative triacylglycerol lipase [Helianthus annuus]KAJ0437144.1 putative triacylglycerol lipase [Helianthus annuus]KAJ0459453.1 putative triacylglycerol lipase [Helianthus annuus]KAJ0643936.1 putative triacylglycerol lipase [Helianthus annuus]KAJ0820147.1 putative triacylglycerol lipase [Helianthus annuus]